MLGRALNRDEVRVFMEIARRIAAIILMEPTLDENYEATKKSPYRWPVEAPHGSASGASTNPLGI